MRFQKQPKVHDTRRVEAAETDEMQGTVGDV